MQSFWKIIIGHLVIYSVVDFSYYAQENVSLAESTNNTSLIPRETPEPHNISLKSEATPRMVTYCVTPNEDPGFCMPLRNCSKLENQLTNESAKEFLRQSKCGPKNENSKNPYVCCGKYSNFKASKACGLQKVAIRGRILGGAEAGLGEYPWLARLYHNRNGYKTFGCTGFLIASKFILTAAHCIQSSNTDNLGPITEVHLGEHDTHTDPDCIPQKTICADKKQIIKVSKMSVHPSYNMDSKDHHHDIGLIYLKKGAKMSSFVSPICMLDASISEPSEYWLSGWGSTSETGSTSNIKLKVAVSPFSLYDCKKKFKTINVKITDKQLCAGGKINKDSCTGDSGGPLMFVADTKQWFAAGVVSFGLGCGREGWPGIYTNITHYHSWIKKTMTNIQKNQEK